jgi:hypothetical protein
MEKSIKGKGRVYSIIIQHAPSSMSTPANYRVDENENYLL